MKQPAEIIQEIEDLQNTIDDDTLLYIDEILEKIESASFIKRGRNGELLVTTTALRLLRENVKIFENIRTLTELEAVINQKYKNIASCKVVYLNGKKFRALVIDMSKIRRR